MKEEKIKPLPFVKEFSDYFVNRAKRILKLRNVEFDNINIDFWDHLKEIWIWFFKDGLGIIARAQFTIDGRQIGTVIDHRKEG